MLSMHILDLQTKNVTCVSNVCIQSLRSCLKGNLKHEEKSQNLINVYIKDYEVKIIKIITNITKTNYRFVRM
jgi:hypothetical protein